MNPILPQSRRIFELVNGPRRAAVAIRASNYASKREEAAAERHFRSTLAFEC
jgi:hypothetical protein